MSEENEITLPAEQQQILEERVKAIGEEYTNLHNLGLSVFKDSNGRLPFIPYFFRVKNPDQEELFLNAQIPKLEEARAEQFCLETCDKAGQDCMTSCTDFARKAFSYGRFIFEGLHKPYAYSELKKAEEE